MLGGRLVAIDCIQISEVFFCTYVLYLCTYVARPSQEPSEPTVSTPAGTAGKRQREDDEGTLERLETVASLVSDLSKDLVCFTIVNSFNPFN